MSRFATCFITFSRVRSSPHFLSTSISTCAAFHAVNGPLSVYRLPEILRHEVPELDHAGRSLECRIRYDHLIGGADNALGVLVAGRF